MKQINGTQTSKKNEYEALERTGPENVRAILAQNNVGSGALIGVGTEALTKGFAQEWLAWHDRQKAEKETAFRSSQIYWTRWAALAATTAAVIGALGWAITGWPKK
jgi:hypothetical protein